MIIIFSSKRDSHVGAVAPYLTEAGVTWVRINTEDFAKNVVLTLSPASSEGILLVKDSGRVIELKAVTAVWYRKPEPIELSHFSLDPAALEYIEAEFTEILMGIYALLGHAIWINNPFTTRLAHRKLRQLQVAAQVGFQVPRTLVTNDLAEVRRFADEVEGDLAIKSLGALNVTEDSGEQTVQYGLFTRRITRADLEAVADKVGYMPTLYQQFIEKRCELRVTCVGRQVYSCSIEAREGDITSDDHRFDTKRLKHTAHPCPELHARLHRYMAAFGLNFACFDIIVTKSGQAVFLECNPNGQWLWCEEMVNLPIGKAIAELLMGKTSGAPSVAEMRCIHCGCDLGKPLPRCPQCGKKIFWETHNVPCERCSGQQSKACPVCQGRGRVVGYMWSMNNKVTESGAVDCRSLSATCAKRDRGNSDALAAKDRHWPYSVEGRLHAEIKSLRNELSRAERRGERREILQEGPSSMQHPSPFA